MKTKILATLLLTSPFLVHAQAPAAVDSLSMVKMGHHSGRDGQYPGQRFAHHVGHHRGADLGMPPFLRDLTLSDAQQDQIFELMHKQAPLLRDKAKASHKAMAELQQLALAEGYDDAKAKVLARSAAEAQAEMALLRAQNNQKIIALLTPEQRKAVTTARVGKRSMPL